MEPPPPTTAQEAIRSWDRPLVMIPLFVLIGLVGGLFPSFSLMALLLVLAIGGTMVWLGMTGRVGRKAVPREIPGAAAWWLAPLLLLALVELFSFLHRSTSDYPTLSLLADPLLDRYMVRSACYVGWLSAFWGLIRR
jgi:hypothetical protein